MIHFLLFTVSILLVISFLRKDRYIFSPSVLVCYSFVLAISCAILNVKIWNIDLGFDTYLIIVLGLIFFCIGDNSKVPQITSFKITRKYIEIPFSVTFFISIISAICTYLYYTEMMRIAFLSVSVYSTPDELMNAFRSQMMFSEDSNAKISQFVVWGATYVAVAAQIYLFVFIYNIIAKVDFFRNSLNFLPIIIYVIQSLMSGGRGSLLAFIASAIFFILIIVGIKRGALFQISLKQLYRIVCVMCICLYLFYTIRILVGRIGTEDVSLFDYLSEYIGASIQNLDMYVKHPETKDKMFGEETFSGIYELVGKITQTVHISNLEFRYTSSGISMGNVYTAFRRYFHDFSWLGIIVIPFFMSRVYSYLNNRLIYRQTEFAQSSLYLIIYSFFLKSQIMMGMEDYFFIELFRVGFLIKLIMTIIMFRFVMKKYYYE